MKRNIAIEIEDHKKLKIMSAELELTLSEVITELLKK
jgi:hypothetical protein